MDRIDEDQTYSQRLEYAQEILAHFEREGKQANEEQMASHEKPGSAIVAQLPTPALTSRPSTRDLDSERKKPLPMGHGIKAYVGILDEIYRIDYFQDDVYYIKGVDPKRDPKIRTRLNALSAQQISQLSKSFKMLIKHENSDKNLAILQLIISSFRSVPGNVYRSLKVARHLLSENVIYVVEALRYEVGSFGPYQATKFKLVTGFFRLVLHRSEKQLPAKQFGILLAEQLDSIVALVTFLCQSKYQHGAEEVYEGVSYKNHSFYQCYTDSAARLPTARNREMISNSFKAGSLDYDKVYYIEYYLVQLLKLVLKKITSQKPRLDPIAARKRLLSTLIMLDEPEILKLYNTLPWS